MSNRYLGVVSLERFLVVERYRESHQPASSANPLHRPGTETNGEVARAGAGAAFLLAGMRSSATPCDPEAMHLRCLIVDDSPRFLDAARGLLERQGIAVVGVASSGAEALQRAAELQPDVTLLDIDLGGESGLELARRLHREAGPARSRVILISTHAEQDYADLIAASPAVGFLPKTALSASAIHDLLAGWDDSRPGSRVSEPPGR
jgi:CheY-like chemotaxis protein